MKTKSLVVSCLLLSVGVVLHALIPGVSFLGGIKPDFLLAMMILAIYLSPDSKTGITTGVLAVILSALTTTFPGGQILSMMDKPVAALVTYCLVHTIKKSNFKLPIITFIGTVVSGIVFVVGAMILSGLKVSSVSLIVFVVLPTAIMNTLLNVLLTRVLK